jgi:hypothetical protein
MAIDSEDSSDEARAIVRPAWRWLRALASATGRPCMVLDRFALPEVDAVCFYAFCLFFVNVLASYSLRSIKWMWHIILWWIWINSCPDLLYYKPRFIVLEHITFSHRFVFYETAGVAGCVTPILIGKHACNDLSLIFLKKLWVKLLYASSIKKHKLW